MAAPEYTPLPTAPARTMTPTAFAAAADAFVAALAAFQTEGDTLGAYTLAQAEAALAAAVAGNLSELDLTALAGWVIGVNTAGDALEGVELIQPSKGADVASATELLVLTDGNSFDVTGTATIETIEDTADAFGIGSIIKLQFDGILILTHHATNLVLLGGANITTAAGDWAEFVKSASGDWRMSSFNGLSTDADLLAGSSTKPSLLSPADIRTAFAATGAAPVYACRAWVNFDGTGTPAITSSANVSSITDNGVGDYTVNFTTALPDANYSVSDQISRGAGNSAQFTAGTYAAGSFRTGVAVNQSGTAFDSTQINFSFFR